jgi:pyruvate dehydrogenase E1 component
VREGIDRMHVHNEDVFYYITVGNEPYAQPPMPEDVEVREGIIRGMYRLRTAEGDGARPRVQLLGSGAILNEVLKAQALLADDFGVAADVWSVTSWTELRREALEVERSNMFNPSQEPRVPYVTRCFEGTAGPIVAASDYLKALPDGLAKWLPAPLVSLGTDGFGRSASRAELRDFFEVDARHIALAALSALARESAIEDAVVQEAMTRLAIDAAKPDPAHA